MSAFAGLVRLDARPVDPGSLARMGNILAPYGPDRTRVWSDGPAGVVHCLKRITPEDTFDRQPLVSRDGRLVLSAYARIDNREELAGLLAIPPAEASRMADSDFILRAFERWGEACAERLLGDFAFAVWDRRRERLHLARDFRGERPLFWHRQGKLVAFATLPKALFALPEVPREIDEESLARHLSLIPATDDEASFYQGVSRVLPAHIVTIDQGRPRARRYHQFDPDYHVRFAREEEYVERARELFDEAVRCRLRSSGAVATQLSSGLDSGTVTATAARLLEERGERLLAYTAVPRRGFTGAARQGRHGDEGPGAAAVAARFPNVDHLLVGMDGLDYLQGLDELAERLDRPTGQPSHRWGERIWEDAGRRGARVLLSGQFGNYTLSYNGLPRLPGLVRKGHLVQWGSEALALRRRRIMGWGGILEKSFGSWVPRRLWDRWVKWHRGQSRDLLAYTPLHPELAGRARIEARARERGHDYGYRPRHDSWQDRLACIYHRDHGEAYANLIAFAGIERRDPTADRRVVEYCLALPESQYLARGETRRLVKRMMAGVLPPEILGLRTRGQQSADWYEGMLKGEAEIRAWLERLAASPEACRLLDVEGMRRLVEHWPKGDWDREERLEAYKQKLLMGIATGAFILHVYPDNRQNNSVHRVGN